MGTWIAGSYTLATTKLVGQKGYHLATVTPGFNKEEALRTLENLSPKFDQTIIAGIPTFIKDLLEEWSTKDNSNNVKNIKLHFAGEGFSENWRKYVLNLADSKDYLHDSVSVLGSADSAIMGFETPLSILLRKISLEDMQVRSKLFNDERLPSLQNYIPEIRFFEVENNELILTANRSIPLIRYNVHDQGGILSIEDIKSVLDKYGYELKKLLKENGIEKASFNLPFIYTFGRGKFVATLYGVNIYPENIREVLVDEEIHRFLTGKFTIETKYSEKQDQYLQLNIELAENVKEEDKLVSSIADIFIRKVRKLNSEYNRMFEEYKEKAIPKIVLYDYGNEKLFPKGQLRKTS